MLVCFDFEINKDTASSIY